MTAGTPAEQPTGEFIVYRTDDGRAEVHLRAVDGTVWLTQAQIADLYDTSQPNVAQTIKRVLADGEVTEATYNSELLVRIEGGREVRRSVKHYNLDMVLAVGYRVTTARAVQFRQWATTVLREYLVKGFAMNDEKLKDPAGLDYFDELLDRIRDIRASEKRFYQKIRDLIADASVDYDPKSGMVHRAFASIQNKLLFAVTGKTAADLIVERCDPSKPNMALTSWKSEVVRKADITIAKNYLAKEEVDELNRLTVMLLDHAGDRARRRKPTTMADWESVTERFLEFNDRDVLTHNGRHSRVHMEQVTGDRYDVFDKQRKREAAELADRQDLAELEAIQAEVEHRA
ncbi:RhuM family protein [Rhodococcus sp. NPDC056960]|uniref:RhuM family protein n=1 Tax=Rhodococcus sp. NPDC056960 TaxID=3345982 RepID=UPI0036377AC0